MGKIDSAQKYIDECTACLEAKDTQMAEKLENTIVAVYSKDIDGIKVGLDRYKARAVTFGTVVTFDYLGDIELLKAKLVHYKEELEAEACKIDNRTSIPAININNVNENSSSANASNYMQVSYEQVIEFVHALPDTALSASDKEALEDKIGALELAVKNKDKKKAIDKVGGVMKFLVEKGVEVGIAVLPYLGQIAQTLQ